MAGRTLSAHLRDLKWPYGTEKANGLAHRPDNSWDRAVTESLRDGLSALRSELEARGHGENEFVTSDIDTAIYVLQRLLQLSDGRADGPSPRDAEVMAAHLPVLLRKIERLAEEIDADS